MVKTKLFSPVLLASAALALSLGAGIVHASTFGTMQGKVTDASGKPVAGVKISLAGEGTVTTDKSGSYVLDGIDPGTYQVAATKKGYQKSTISVTILQDVPQEVDVTLTAQDAKSSDAKSSDAKSSDAKSSDAKSSDAKSSSAASPANSPSTK